jgi:outer membrane protein TolC
MKRLLFPALCSLSTASHAQELTLDSAIAQALRHDHIQQQIGDIDAASALRDHDRSSAWYPQLTLNAQSTIQNEQIAFPISFPGVTPPEVPLDFHRALLNFNQTLYDGNTTRARRRLETIDADRQQLEAEARTIDLRAQVIQRYMSILVCAEQLRLLGTKANTLEEQRQRIHTAVDNGAALASEEDALRAELITTGQEHIEVESTEHRMRSDLALLTGEERNRTAALAQPVMDARADLDPAQRPDVRAFGLREQVLEAQLDVATALRRPTLNFFGNAGVGSPGYNTFNGDIRPMLLAGVGLQWRILDWGQLKRQRSISDLQRGDLLIERDRLLRNVNMAISAQDEEARKMDRLLEKDNELIGLRGSVAKAKSEQLALGTATASDYITELNKENAARLGLEIHQLQRILAQRMRLNIAGQ